MRILETTPPLEVGLAGVGVTPGPSHWKTGVPSVTPLGRAREQVRVTVSPVMTVGEEGDREMVDGSVRDVSTTRESVTISLTLMVFALPKL